MMDLEGWFSATPEAIAKHQAGVCLLAPAQVSFPLQSITGAFDVQGEVMLALVIGLFLLTDLFTLFKPCASLD